MLCPLALCLNLLSTAQEPSLPPTADLPEAQAPLLDHASLTDAILQLANGSELCSVEVIGESRGGRPIHALRVAAGEPSPGRPGLLVVAGVDGPYAYTSGLALQHARDLVAGGEIEEIRQLLETTTVWIIPRANPDGAEARFQEPLQERWATGHGVDQDRDGRLGEDGPSDVNGDGIISWIRSATPLAEATHVVDPADPRALRDASRTERASWRLLPEGLDDDGDGSIAEDPVLDAEVNRNFALDFEEHTPRAGLYPGHEPETRVLYDFVLAHPELQLVLTYGQLDNLVESPSGVADDAPARMRVPPSGWRSSDVELLQELGRRYREASSNRTGGTGDPAGTFQHWAYGHRGLWSLCVRPWAIPLDSEGGPAEGETEEQTEERLALLAEASDDARRLAWIDSQGDGDAWRHLGWTLLEHPDLVIAEVGGFAPYADIEPPATRRAELATEHLTFLQGLGPVLARLRFREVGITGLGGGLHRVTARLGNDGMLPLFSRSGELTRSTRPARVRIELPPDAELLAGRPQRLVSEVPGLGVSEELLWLVRTSDPKGIRLTLDSDHAGTDAYPEQ